MSLKQPEPKAVQALKCSWCGIEFTGLRRIGVQTPFCSTSCRAQWSQSHSVQCEICGKTFHRPESLRQGGADYCSNECRHIGHRIPLADRFWSKVDKNGPILIPSLGQCWLWTGDHHDWGYGRLWTPKGQPTLYAHRVSWELHYGQIPEGVDVLHHCDNPPCPNPEHLFLGDQVANNEDRQSKGRTPHGPTHYTSKLKTSDIPIIRELLKSHSQREVAVRYGLTVGAISAVARCKTWKHVP